MLSRFIHVNIRRIITAHGGGRVVSASGSETCVTSSMTTSAIIYDAYTSIKKKKKDNLELCQA